MIYGNAAKTFPAGKLHVAGKPGVAVVAGEVCALLIPINVYGLTAKLQAGRK